MLAGDVGETFLQVDVERGPTQQAIYERLYVGLTPLLVGLAAALSLVAVALVTGELRTDLSALASAGAGKGFRAALNGGHAGFVTLLGVIAGGGVAAVSTAALLQVVEVPWAFRPWAGMLAVTAAAVLVAFTAGALGGSRTQVSLRRLQ